MKFSDLSGLPVRIAIYIPSTYDVDKPINNSYIVERTAKLFSMLYGGCTAQESCGYYVANNNDLIQEKVTIVFSYTDNDTFAKHEEKVLQYAKTVKKEMKQESVSIELNNSLYFI